MMFIAFYIYKSLYRNYFHLGVVANPTLRQFDRASRRFVAIPNKSLVRRSRIFDHRSFE